MKFFLSCEAFDLEHTAHLPESTVTDVWRLSPSSAKRISRPNARTIRVLPRPPKLEIRSLASKDEYYTNEAIELGFEIANAEEEDASTRLDVTLFGHAPPLFSFRTDALVAETASSTGNEEEETRTLSASVGTIKTLDSVLSTIRVEPVEFSSRYDLTLQLTYHLASDPATSIIQTAAFQLNVANPFEANYDLLPRLHPEPWPSLFDFDEVRDITGEDDAIVAPKGLSQAWCLVTRYASFAAENLKVTGLDLKVQTPPGMRCYTTEKAPTLERGGLEVSPKTIEEASFDIVARKDSLDSRGPVSLDAAFIIKWTRLGTADSDAAVNTTILPVPRLNILGTEPRVLASISYLEEPYPLAVLDVVIENASNHFLTFGLTMEPSDDFAFSGSKQMTLHLLPVSRRSVTYRLLPLVRGAWVKPGLVVRDKYFQKVLRIIPTEGMKFDKDGFLIWIPPEDAEQT